MGERGYWMRQKENTLGSDYWLSRLRKFAHIMDKGMQRKDFAVGHSNAYYSKAIAANHQIKAHHLEDQSYIWASEKLEKYQDMQETGIPMKMEPPQKPSINEAELYQHIKSRRSIRRFLGDTIDREKLVLLAEALQWCPTSCNKQPGKIFFAEGAELVKKCMQLCAGGKGFSGDIPVFMCFCADIRGYDMPHEVMLPYVDLGLGVQNVNLMAHSMGLATTMLSWAQSSAKEEKELKKILKIPSHYHIIVNGVCGYPETGAPIPERRAPNLSILSIEDVR